MSSITGIAQSGLDAAATRLGASAHNVANALTEGFVPSRVSSAEVAAGGVTSSPSATLDPLAEARADRALLAPSRTDLVTEMVGQLEASRLYQANLASLKTADELFEAALRMKR